MQCKECQKRMSLNIRIRPRPYVYTYQCNDCGQEAPVSEKEGQAEVSNALAAAVEYVFRVRGNGDALRHIR